RLDATTHVLLLVLHHVAADGWSLGPLWRDVATAYEARRQGRAPAWAPLGVQYADYAVWERAVLGTAEAPTAVARAQLAYWQRQLADLPGALALPTRAGRRQAAPGGGVVPLTVDAATHAGLVAVARQTHATLFMVVQAALAA